MSTSSKFLKGFSIATSVAALVALVVDKNLDFDQEVNLTEAELEQDLFA
jgi:hypothetical protein